MLALPQRSPIPINVPWTWSRRARTAARGAGDGDARVVVAVHAHGAAQNLYGATGSLKYFLRHGAAVRIAQADDVRARGLRGAQGFQRVAGICSVAVKKVFRIEYNLFGKGLEIGDGVCDHAQVLLYIGLQHALDLHIPRLAKQGDDGRARVPQSEHAPVLLHSSALFSGRSQTRRVSHGATRGCARAQKRPRPWGWSRDCRPRRSPRRNRRAHARWRACPLWKKRRPAPCAAVAQRGVKRYDFIPGSQVSPSSATTLLMALI